MEGEYIGKHAPKEESPWDKFAAEMNEDYVPKHGKAEVEPEQSEEEKAEKQKLLDEQAEQERSEEEKAEKQKLLDALEMAKEDLLKAERDFSETDEIFDKTVRDLEMAMENKSADVDELRMLLKQAREAMEDFRDASNKLDKASDDFSFYNQRAVAGEALSEQEFEDNRNIAMEDFKKVDKAKTKINGVDDNLGWTGRKINMMQ
ncbi:hypothetical protein IIZ77_00320 [Candidatus Saccharibacteria bacterium]|nr:hypothetical protein [Candidatus Saccharibacteria bacterium]